MSEQKKPGIANYTLPKHKSLAEKKDSLQPYRRQDGLIQVNENYIKAYGADAHPEKEVRDFYKKKGY